VLSSFHPAVEAIRTIRDRLKILILGSMSLLTAHADAKGASDSWEAMRKLERDAATLLGDQLRRLPMNPAWPSSGYRGRGAGVAPSPSSLL
jgi:hypothetical protein